MQFTFSKEEETFRRELRSFLKKELPLGWRYGLIESAEEDAELERSMRRKLADRGWLTLGWPREYGGQDASPITQLVFYEEMAYHRAPGKDAFGIGMLGPALMMHGTEEQKRRYLGQIARGEINWCQGFSEPGSGSDLASLQSRAVEDGDDFVISGQKIWTSGAHHADRFFMLARTDPEAPKHRGITFFLGDMSDPGVEVRPIVSATGRHSFNEVFFDNVRVNKRDIVGEVNRGWYVAVTLLGFERSTIEWPAAARRALEELVRYAKETQVNGSALMDDPRVRHKLADAAIDIEVARMLCYRVAWLATQGQAPDSEGSIAKVYATGMLKRFSEIGMQVMGLTGQLAADSKYAALEGGMRHMYLETIGVNIAGGTSDIQRNIIATRGLGLPRGT